MPQGRAGQAHGGTIEVWGDGEQTRSFCYIDDCVEGIYRLMRSDYAEPLNLGQDRMVTINELADIVIDDLGQARDRAAHVAGPAGRARAQLGQHAAARGPRLGAADLARGRAGADLPLDRGAGGRAGARSRAGAEPGRGLTLSDRLAPHPPVATVFRALDEAGVRWCLLRGAEDLARPAGDIDLLVAPQDVDSLARAIAPLGFARLPAWGFASHRFYLGYDPGTDVWLKLDVVTELAFGPWFSLRAETAPRAAFAAAGGAMASRSSTTPMRSGACSYTASWTRAPSARQPPRCSDWPAPGCAASPLAREIDRLVANGPVSARLLDAARRGASRDELLANGAAVEAAWTRSQHRAVVRRRATGRVARLADRSCEAVVA